MKRLSFLLIPFILLLFNSCKKKVDVNNYHPKVRTTGVELLADGSVKVSGEIISEGNTPLVLVGFCMDTLPDPDMLSNQKSTDTLYGNTFSCVYPSLNAHHTYYFKAWAANEEGYAVGEAVHIDSVYAQEIFIPCTPPLDTFTSSNPQITRHEKYYSISKITQSGTEYEIDLHTNTRIIEMIFSKQPVNGIYKTVENISLDKTVVIRCEGYLVKSGADVYVKQLNSDEIEVTICSAKVFNGFVTDSISTRFTTSY